MIEGSRPQPGKASRRSPRAAEDGTELRAGPGTGAGHPAGRETGAGPRARGEGDAGHRARRIATAAWGASIVVASAAGAVLHGLGVLTIDHLPPLHGHFRLPPIALLPAVAFAAVAFAAVAVPALPSLTRRLRFGWALAVAYGSALAWTVLLAISADGLAEPFTHPQEYPAVLPAVGDDPLGWLDTFTERLPGYPTHVRGHPPLAVLVVWALRAAGLAGPLWAALLVVAVGCSATVAIALTVRGLAGEEAARGALPYLALTPASVWIATTMDAFFAGVGAWGSPCWSSAGARRAGCSPRPRPGCCWERCRTSATVWSPTCSSPSWSSWRRGSRGRSCSRR
nr:hypothetical protein GCM10020093_110480 [Planobispora longispora]